MAVLVLGMVLPFLPVNAQNQAEQATLLERFQELMGNFLGQVTNVRLLRPAQLSNQTQADTHRLIEQKDDLLNRVDPVDVKSLCGQTPLPVGILGQTVRCDGKKWVADSFLKNFGGLVHIGDDWTPPLPIKLEVVAVEEVDGPNGPETPTAIYGYSKNPFIAGAGIKGVSEFGKGIMGSSQHGTGVFGISTFGQGVVSVGSFRQYLNNNSSFEGQLGIGTENPFRKLHVAVDGTGESSALFTNNVTGHGANDGLLVGVNNNQVNATIWNYENGYLRLGTNNAEHLRIAPNGNVGLGTTQPVFKLHIFRPDGWSGILIESGGVQENSLVKLVNREGNWEVSNDGTRQGSFTIRQDQSQIPEFMINSNGNIGIGTTNPGTKLEVSGGVKVLPPANTRPACSVTFRGTFWFEQGATGVKDNVSVCAKDATNNYAWRTLY